MNDDNLIVCTRCGRKYANYVNVYEFMPPKDSRNLWTYFNVHVNHTIKKDHLPPYVNCPWDTIICNICVENAELYTLRALPLEDLPLHINTHWLTEEGRTLFQKRLQELM